MFSCYDDTKDLKAKDGVIRRNSGLTPDSLWVEILEDDDYLDKTNSIKDRWFTGYLYCGTISNRVFDF